MYIVASPGWVVIEPLEDEEQKVGGLVLADTAKDTELTRGKLVNFSSEEGITQAGAKFFPPVMYEIGQMVAYKKYADHPIDVEGKKYKLVHMENIMAVLK